MSREIWREIINKSTRSTEKLQDLVSELESNYTVSKKDSTIETRKKQFACIVGQLGSEYKREMLVEFYNYWTETSINGKKLRYEKEKVFDVKLRLARWHKNSKQNGKPRNNGHSISESTNLAQRILRGELS